MAELQTDENILEFLRGTGPVTVEAGRGAALEQLRRTREETTPLSASDRGAIDFLRGIPVPEDFATRVPGIFPSAIPLDLKGKAVEESTIRRATLSDLRAQGVDIETGGEIGPRARLGLIDRNTEAGQERRERLLGKIFPDGFEETEAGTVVSVKDPATGKVKRLLLDEVGFSIGDFGDAAGDLLEAGGEIATAATLIAFFPEIAAGTVISGLTLATLTALGGQLTGGAAEAAELIRSLGLDFDELGEIAKERGQATVVNAALNAGLLLGFKGVGAAGQGILAPTARTQAIPENRLVAEAAARAGFRESLTAGEITGSPVLLRGEALRRNVPGAAGPIRQRDVAFTARAGEVERQLGEGATAGEAGEAVRGALRGQAAEAEAGLAATRQQVGLAGQRELELGLERLSPTEQAAAAVTAAQAPATLGGKTTPLPEQTRETLQRLEARARQEAITPALAGDIGRETIRSNRDRFQAKQGLLEEASNDLINQLPEKARAFVGTENTVKVATRLKGRFPKDAQGREITELVSPAVAKAVSGTGKLKRALTVQEIRDARSILANQINERAALGLPEDGALKALVGAMTKDLRAAASNAPTPEIKKALNAALDNAREGRIPFESFEVSKALSPEGSAGFIRPAELLPMRLAEGKDASQLIRAMGKDSLAVNVGRRGAFQMLLNRATPIEEIAKGRTFGLDIADTDILFSELQKLGKDGLIALFGTEREAARVIQTIGAARQAGVKNIDIAAFKAAPGNEELLPLLERVVAEQQAFTDTFENTVVKPLIAGEAVGAVQGSDVIRFILSKGDTKATKALLARLPDDVRNDVSSGTLDLLLGKAAKSGISGKQRLQIAADSTIEPGSLLKTMQTGFGATSKESEAVLRQAINTPGNEGKFELLRDFAIVMQRKQQAEQAGKAAGGLIAGSIISNLMKFQLGTAVTVAKFKLTASMLDSTLVRAWLTGQLQLPGAVRLERIRNLAARKGKRPGLFSGLGKEAGPLTLGQKIALTAPLVVPELTRIVNEELDRGGAEEFLSRFDEVFLTDTALELE